MPSRSQKLIKHRFDVPHDCSVELSHPGYEFFTGLFERYDKDRDGALNAKELSEIFSTSPGNPWANTTFPDTTIADDLGSVTLQGWLAQWRYVPHFSHRMTFLKTLESMTTLLDHKTTLAYLAHLGFPGESTTSALKIIRPRKSDRGKGKSSRNVFLCYVCGAAGSGKTSLLSRFAGKPYRDHYLPTTKPVSVVNSVEIDGIEKYLVVSPDPSN